MGIDVNATGLQRSVGDSRARGYLERSIPVMNTCQPYTQPDSLALRNSSEMFEMMVATDAK